jgi:hypothetical protein
MVASEPQGSGDDATAIAFGLDSNQDRVLTEAITAPAGTKTLTNHYDDASGETAWTSTLKIDGTTVTKRYVDGIDGNLSATVADDGTVKLDLTNLHGDTVATIDPDATSIANYHETTEYRLPVTPLLLPTIMAGWVARSAPATTWVALLSWASASTTRRPADFCRSTRSHAVTPTPTPTRPTPSTTTTSVGCQLAAGYTSMRVPS